MTAAFAPGDEVDELRWVPLGRARELLSYALGRGAAPQADHGAAGHRPTRPGTAWLGRVAPELAGGGRPAPARRRRGGPRRRSSPGCSPPTGPRSWSARPASDASRRCGRTSRTSPEPLLSEEGRTTAQDARAWSAELRHPPRVSQPRQGAARPDPPAHRGRDARLRKGAFDRRSTRSTADRRRGRYTHLTRVHPDLHRLDGQVIGTELLRHLTPVRERSALPRRSLREAPHRRQVSAQTSGNSSCARWAAPVPGRRARRT